MRRSVLGIVMGILTLAGNAAPVSAQYYYTWEEVGPNYLWGNLTWSGGKGRIVWGPPTGTENNVLPWSQTPEPLLKVGDDAYTQTNLDARGMPPPVLFESDPLPFDLWVNVTRPIQLEVTLKDHAQNPEPCNYYSPVILMGNVDPYLEAELTLEGKPLASGRSDASITWGAVYPSRKRPADPAGYGVCRFPMHTESERLEAGSVLKLSVFHIRQEYYYAYGFGEEHPSTIKIPYYSEEEVIYRYPPADTEVGEIIEVDAAASGVLGVASLLAALGAIGRGRRVVSAAAMLLVMGALAGCIGTSKPKSTITSEDLGGTIDNSIIAQPYTGDGGAIYGLIFDVFHIPVSGVHVSLLGTNNFTSSDAKGRFTFENLPPATYRLRFDHRDFRSLEGAVSVKAGKISQPKVMLVPKTLASSDLRPHLHDYWPEGVTSKKLADVVLTPQCTGTSCTMPTEFRMQPTETDANTVLPGTYNVEITMHWDTAASKLPRLGLMVMTNHAFSTFGYVYQNMSRFAPRAPGESFNIRTSWETTDAGHQPYSTWKFAWYVGGMDRPTRDEAPERDLPTYMPQGITFKITLHKGEVPLEPPHPDRWKGGNKATIYKDAYVSFRMGTAPPGTGCTSVACDRGYFSIYAFYPAVQGIVPSGTKWVEATLTYSKAPTVAYDFILRYKPADVPFYKANQATGVGYKRADPVPDSDPLKTTWRFEIKESEADPEYARASAWLFYAEPDDPQAAWLDQQTSGSVVICCPLPQTTYTFSATARNDAKPA